jgi:hypothetical protein
MQKLKLKLDDLRVDTFEMATVRKKRGTVLGEQCTCYTECTCPGCPTCDVSCNGTCAGCGGGTNLRESCGGFECYTNYRCPNGA